VGVGVVGVDGQRFMAGGNRFFVAVALDQGGAEIAVRLCVVRCEVYRFPVSRDGFVASMQFEKRISEVVAGPGDRRE